MPVLDCQMWIGEEARQKGIPQEFLKGAQSITKVGYLKKILLFCFYKKPMANKCGNMQKSGLPESTKVSTATKECIRRLKNTSRELLDDIIKGILTEYMSELAQGG